jgi:hypothetical protein
MMFYSDIYASHDQETWLEVGNQRKKIQQQAQG